MRRSLPHAIQMPTKSATSTHLRIPPSDARRPSCPHDSARAESPGRELPRIPVMRSSSRERLGTGPASALLLATPHTVPDLERDEKRALCACPEGSRPHVQVDTHEQDRRIKEQGVKDIATARYAPCSL